MIYYLLTDSQNHRLQDPKEQVVLKSSEDKEEINSRKEVSTREEETSIKEEETSIVVVSREVVLSLTTTEAKEVSHLDVDDRYFR